MDYEKIFLEAYDKYADAIFRHCYFHLARGREEAKDLTQETFSRAWKYMAGGHKVENLRALLYRIATNLIIDTIRRKRAISLDELTEKGFEIGTTQERELIEKKADINILLSCLSDLDQKYREVVVLRYIDDLAVNHIAEIIGETENNVSVKIHRALDKLREIFSKRYPNKQL